MSEDKEHRDAVELRLRQSIHAVLATGITNVVADKLVTIVPSLASWLMGELYHPEAEAGAKLHAVEEWVTSDVVTDKSPWGDGYRACQRDLRDKLGVIGPRREGGADEK